MIMKAKTSFTSKFGSEFIKNQEYKCEPDGKWMAVLNGDWIEFWDYIDFFQSFVTTTDPVDPIDQLTLDL